MDTSAEERQLFEHITCILNMPDDEISSPQALALGNIEQVRIINAAGPIVKANPHNTPTRCIKNTPNL
jgi:hypothetical protein